MIAALCFSALWVWDPSFSVG
ncbi:hypothetical protein EMIT0P43_20388 [Pseudomonas jessenii]